MHYVALAHIIHAEREREIEATLRRRRLLKPDDDPIEPPTPTDRQRARGATLDPRAHPSGG